MVPLIFKEHPETEPTLLISLASVSPIAAPASEDHSKQDKSATTTTKKVFNSTQKTAEDRCVVYFSWIVLHLYNTYISM